MDIVARLRDKVFPRISRVFTVRPFRILATIFFWVFCAAFFLGNGWLRHEFFIEILKKSSEEPPASSVLGAQVEQKLEISYEFWKRVIQEKPDYRDAYVQLAIVTSQLKKTDEAKMYIERAAELDPNNATTAHVREDLGL